MDIFPVIKLVGGLALFLFGMNVMGDSLEKHGGAKIKSILEKMTSTPVKGVLLGAIVTALIQSSSATTVMVVGFVNSGIMKLSQSIGVIMGANIGTTVTAWLISLTGIESDNIFMQMLKPANFSFVLAFVGILLYSFVGKGSKKHLGSVFLGFTVLIVGLEYMSDAVKPLANIPEFQNIMLLFTNPVFGVLAGMFVTGIIQSSSASVGILQALSVTGQVRYSNAVPIILGQNIGTCVTALLSSVGTNKNAKRTAVVHLSFNIIGTVTFLIVFYAVDFFVGFAFMNDSINEFGIAVVHTLFNVFSTLLLLPFTKQLEKLACFVIRDDKSEKTPDSLDERLFEAPAFAVERAKKSVDEMAIIARDSILTALDLIFSYDPEKAHSVKYAEERADEYEDRVGAYLVKLSRVDMTSDDSRRISMLLHAIGDFERISDHAVNIAETAEEINQKHITFSPDAVREIENMQNAVREIITMTVNAFLEQNADNARRVEPLEQVIDELNIAMKANHIARLKADKCTIETGFVYSDFLTNCERAADHCSNIAIFTAGKNETEVDPHSFLECVRADKTGTFEQLCDEYAKKYHLIRQ